MTFEEAHARVADFVGAVSPSEQHPVWDALDKLDELYRAASTKKNKHAGEVDLLRDVVNALVTERDAALARAEKAEAEAAVRGGEWCAKNRAEGRGPCGACAWCCKQAVERAERAEALLRKFREVM